MSAGAKSTTTWDLTALLNAADPRAPLPERQLWLARLTEWLRHEPPRREGADAEARSTPAAVLRLRHLLNVLEQHPEHHERVGGILRRFWGETDAAALYADFGFPHRLSLAGELWRRLRARLLPATPDTTDLAELFPLLFDPGDEEWIEAIDEPTLHRLAALLAPADDGPAPWRRSMADAITILVSAVHGAGFSPALRRRMDTALLADEPFRQLALAGERLRQAVEGGDAVTLRQEALFLRALLDRCRQAADSIAEHLEEFGVSVDIVFEADQLRERTLRIEALLDCILGDDPPRELQRLSAQLARTLAEHEGLRAPLARHHEQLARKMTERSAETGSHYITRTRSEYRSMFARAAGGGTVLAGTTFVKFAVMALGLSAFWSGVAAGLNYAFSFVLIMLLHWTVATKQPAMTAPAMAARLRNLHDDAAVEGFVDEVAHLIRSQSAGIFGNLALVFPVVLGVQLLAQLLLDRPLVGEREAEHVLHSLTLLGPTPLFAAFTGVLLFTSSLIAGWTENWFVFHRLDSAIAWNPRIVSRLGALRAQRWAAWARANVSGLAANVSLGLMLGLVPPLLGFVGLPMDVRHVTLSTGQLAAAVGAVGLPILSEPAFWWCVAGIVLTALLNVGVSFWLAFKLALRSRGLRLRERARIAAAIRRRLRQAPLSFLVPPRD